VNLGWEHERLYLGMWVREVRQDAEGQVAACRVAADDEIGRVTTVRLDKVAEKLDGLRKLSGVCVLGCKGVCEN
jgi:hypothetical protein